MPDVGPAVELAARLHPQSGPFTVDVDESGADAE
jgi:hypothetical protein